MEVIPGAVLGSEVGLDSVGVSRAYIIVLWGVSQEPLTRFFMVSTMQQMFLLLSPRIQWGGIG